MSVKVVFSYWDYFYFSVQSKIYLLIRKLKLKLQYFGHLMWGADSFEKTMMLGKIEGGRRRKRQRMRWLGGIMDSMGLSLSKLWELVIVRDACSAVVHGVAKRRTQLSNWTELKDNSNTLVINSLSFFSKIIYLSFSKMIVLEPCVFISNDNKTQNYLLHSKWFWKPRWHSSSLP